MQIERAKEFGDWNYLRISTQDSRMFLKINSSVRFLCKKENVFLYKKENAFFCRGCNIYKNRKIIAYNI